MDKRKLIQIIEKELEELKILSEEIAEAEDKTSLIIDLALSKARLLCQEIELLRELTANDDTIPSDGSPEENGEEQFEEDEISGVNISDPELEIVEFEEPEPEEAPGFDDEFDPEDADNEETTEDEDNEETTDDDLTDDEDEEENESEFIEEEIEEEGLIEFGGNNNDEIEDEGDEKPRATSTIESTELKTDPQAGVREITIDEEDIEPAKGLTASAATDRPVMREIPKPEELVLEKPVSKESLKKENSLNDSIGETKSAESPITNGPITSLRAAIGLNDRFLFIREIFGNNTDKYNTVIDKLDKLETIQQAVDYLKATLTLQKNETSMKFVDLLKRRFSK
jgi:hypothetical protein